MSAAAAGQPADRECPRVGARANGRSPPSTKRCTAQRRNLHLVKQQIDCRVRHVRLRRRRCGDEIDHAERAANRVAIDIHGTRRTHGRRAATRLQLGAKVTGQVRHSIHRHTPAAASAASAAVRRCKCGATVRAHNSKECRDRADSYVHGAAGARARIPVGAACAGAVRPYAKLSTRCHDTRRCKRKAARDCYVQRSAP